MSITLKIKTNQRPVKSENDSRAFYATHHTAKCKKFATNETIEKLLKIEIGDKFANLGDVYLQTTNQLNSLEDNFCKVNDLIKDPKNFIYEKISDLKREIDLRKEKLKAEIDKTCAEMIAKLDEYQQECYENIPSLKLVDASSDALLQAQKYPDEVTKDNNQLLLVSNDSKRKEIQIEAKQLDRNLFVRCENLKEDLMMNKVWAYKERKTSVNDFQRELKQFDE